MVLNLPPTVQCNGIHSSVSKAMCHSINIVGNGGSTDSPIVVAGEKSDTTVVHSYLSDFLFPRKLSTSMWC